MPSSEEQKEWRGKLGLRAAQQLFFSGLRYAQARRLKPDGSLGAEVDLVGAGCVVLTGIADPTPFLAHVNAMARTIAHHAFPDHHAFTAAELRKAAERLATFAAGPKLLVTTEKDAMRLLPHLRTGPLAEVTIAVVTVEAMILNEPARFKQLLLDHVGTHQAHR